MSIDATFEQGREAPLRLRAIDEADLPVISAFLQDAVGQTSEISWMPRRRRFAMLLNRFRWEDRDAAERQKRPFERVQALLVVESVLKVTAQGIDPRDRELVFEVLSVAFAPGDDGSGRVLITLAGDGVLALEVECLEVTLTDQSRPYIARSQRPPQHPGE